MPHKTRRLYFEDAYQTEFTGRVLAARQYNDQPALVLDQTCFYPEGGGQPTDLGTLSDRAVLQVVEHQEEILHVLESDLTDDTVRGSINWDLRFDHMQQHAGQHVLSQCFDKLLSGRTESFHLGEKLSTLEIALSSISEKDLEHIEHCANQVVFQNREIKTYMVEGTSLSRVPLRKPPKKSGSIRVVEVAGFDYTACGGTHPRRTGEIGLIKLLRRAKIRNNVRFEFVCGGRALRDYRFRNRILAETAAIFTAGEADLPQVADKLLNEQKETARTLKKLRDQAIQQEALDFVKDNPESLSLRCFQERPLQEVRQLALAVIRNPGIILLWGLRAGPRVHVILARSEDVSLDMRELIPIIAPSLNAKGGGRPSLVELAGDKPEALNGALQAAKDSIES
jgi:alanyl-tRNA synthetase